MRPPTPTPTRASRSASLPRAPAARAASAGAPPARRARSRTPTARAPPSRPASPLPALPSSDVNVVNAGTVDGARIGWSMGGGTGIGRIAGEVTHAPCSSRRPSLTLPTSPDVVACVAASPLLAACGLTRASVAADAAEWARLGAVVAARIGLPPFKAMTDGER